MAAFATVRVVDTVVIGHVALPQPGAWGEYRHAAPRLSRSDAQGAEVFGFQHWNGVADSLHVIQQMHAPPAKGRSKSLAIHDPVEIGDLGAPPHDRARDPETRPADVDRDLAQELPHHGFQRLVMLAGVGLLDDRCAGPGLGRYDREDGLGAAYVADKNVH